MGRCDDQYSGDYTMKTITTLVAAGFALAFAVPAFAEDMDPATMTCADLAAMDAAGQMHSVEMVGMAADAMATEAGTEVMASTMTMEETTAAVLEACTGMADALVMDELHAVHGSM
jgi:hypothetical protein